MIQCRICLEEEGEFFSPCLCKGSVKHVHRKCLETWLKTAAINTNKCTICKAEYLRRPPLKYAMQDCCADINHNGIVIFSTNVIISTSIGIPILYLYHPGNPPIIFIGLVNIILVFVELLYGFTVTLKYKLNCKKICPFLILTFLTGGIAIESNSKNEYLFTTILLMFNFFVSMLFKDITRQMSAQKNAFILPYEYPHERDSTGECKVII